jgi:hypothetical protein
MLHPLEKVLQEITYFVFSVEKLSEEEAFDEDLSGEEVSDENFQEKVYFNSIFLTKIFFWFEDKRILWKIE